MGMPELVIYDSVGYLAAILNLRVSRV